MNSRQRKAHKYIWLLLAIVVPVIMFFSVRDLQFSVKEAETKAGIPQNSAVIKGAENDIAQLILTKERTIFVTLKSPIKSPSAIVYVLNKDGSRGGLLGQLTSSVIIHPFEIGTQDIAGIIIYDSLKETEITKLQF